MSSFLKKLNIIDSNNIEQDKIVKKLKPFFDNDNSIDSFSLKDLDNNEVDLDKFVKMISKAKKTDGYIARTCNNLLQKSLKTGWFFESRNEDFSNEVEKRFNELLFNSNLNPRGFIRQLLKNLIDYSNVFIYKIYNKNTKRLDSVWLFPSKGWKAKKIVGNIVLEWEFTSGDKTQKFTNDEIIHISYNKETHEIFGTPFMCSILEDVQLLRNIEAASIEDYFKYLSKKTIVKIGDKNSSGSAKEIESVAQYLNSLDENEDIVVSNRVDIGVIEPKYTPPEFILNTMRERTLAGLLSSNSQMGMSGSGRQDADTQETKESIIVSDFQENLEDQLNNTLIKELFKELHPNKYDFDNAVYFKFRKNQNEYERSNNHFLNLYNCGVISFDELRDKIQMNEKDFDENKSIDAIKFNWKKKESKLNQTKSNSMVSKPSVKLVKSLNQPSNQYGTNVNSKPSVKN